MQVPNENNQILQSNKGTTDGNVFSTWNMDFHTDQGKITSGGNALKFIDKNDDAQFSGYACNILEYNDDFWAISDYVFDASPTSGASIVDTSWSQDSRANTPAVANTSSDAVVFDGKLLVVDGDDIASFNGSAWTASWWQGTLGAAALTTGQRIILNVGSKGRLQVIDGGNKVHTVTTAGTEYIGGSDDGALDYSSTEYILTCAESTSNRTWIGTQNTAGGEAVILEWDESTLARTANKQHKVGANKVLAIAIYNDTPIAILSTGKIKYFDGNGFVDWPNAQFPNIRNSITLDDEFMHPNGWAIIDGMPHFLVKGTIAPGTTYADAVSSASDMPFGIYCLDPQRGLYHRFALGAGTATQFDKGQVSVKEVGALHATADRKTKFIASYEYYDETSTAVPTLVYQDQSLTKTNNSFFITQPTQKREVPQMVEAYHKKLNTGDSIKFYYQQYEQDPIQMSGTWASTTQFNSTDSYGDAEVGNLAWVKVGAGAGNIEQISALDTTSTVCKVTLDTAVSEVTAEDQASIEILKFKYLGAITSTALDFKTFTLPSTVKSRHVRLLAILEPAQGNKVVLDNVII